MEEDLEINILTTVVDGSKAKLYMKNFGEFFNDQVSESSTIVVSRIDKISEEKLDEVVHLLKDKNKYATIITTDIKLLDGKKLLNVLESEEVIDDFIKEVENEHHHHDEEECCCGHHHGLHHHHHADEVFTSWGKETHKSYSSNELNSILEELSNNESIIRSKGIVKANDNEKWYYFDLVSGEYEIRLGNPDVVGKVCVIGSNIDEEMIKGLFK